MGITVTGLDETISALKYIAADINDTALPEAIAEAADQLVTQAQGRAPVDTGFLRDNIQIVELTPTYAVVSSLAEYSIYVEEGTWKMHAQPFMMPSVQEVQDTFPSLVGAKIAMSIRENLH